MLWARARPSSGLALDGSEKRRVDHEDVDRFGTQRAAEVAGPLVAEAIARLGLDPRAKDLQAARVLGDLAARMFEAGFSFGASETTAAFLEAKLPHIKVNFDSVNRELPERGPLGEGEEWEGFTPGA